MDTFEPGPAPRHALWEVIVDSIRRAIVLGELPSGLHLEEPALAQKFGVSRIPVREALVRLEQEGLVRVEPRRGAFIIGMTEDDIQDIYQFRLLLETHAVRRAAERVDDVGLARLQALVDQMDAAVRAGEPALMAAPDVDFHRQTVVIAGSRALLTAWERTASVVATILSITDTTYRNMPEAVDGHRRMVDALERHDPDDAERELRAHLANGERVMREAMRQAQAARLAGAR